MTEEPLSLDDLFRDAKAAYREMAKAKAKQPLPVIDPLEIWRNPANWTRMRGVALIHEETQTLLGNFTEYVHRTVKDARRLVRETPGLPPDSTEFVQGNWSSFLTTPTMPKQAQHVSYAATLDLELSSLGAKAPRIPILAYFDGERLARVELTERTIFAVQDHFIYLPKGTNVLAELPATLQTTLRRDLL